MTIKKAKPPKTFEEQLELLISRGLIVENKEEATKCLSSLNYYRLRGYYIHLLKEGSDDFIPNVSFSHILSLHDFDTEFRLILLRLLFDIEITARTRIAYVLGHAWDALGYTQEKNYDGCNSTQFAQLMDGLKQSIKNSREIFVKKHRDCYGGNLPIWVAVEIMSFGELSKIYSLLPVKLRNAISKEHYKIDETLMKNWLYIASLLRNICAHNSRLFNKKMTIPVKISKHFLHCFKNALPSSKIPDPLSLFSYILVLKSLSSEKTWQIFLSSLNRLFCKYNGDVFPAMLGFPAQWEEIYGSV